MLRRLVPFIVALLAAAVASAAADPTRYMPAELIAGTLDPAPGRTILVGIRMTPRPGWHGYWSNPGDSGIATTVRWSAPGGESFGPLLHPAPSLLSAGGVDSYVHEGEHILLSRRCAEIRYADVQMSVGVACTEADHRFLHPVAFRHLHECPANEPATFRLRRVGGEALRGNILLVQIFHE